MVVIFIIQVTWIMTIVCFEKEESASFLKPWFMAEALDVLCNSQYLTDHELNMYIHTNT